MKKRMITSLFLAGLMASNIVSASAANIKFNDVPENAWYASSVDYAVEKNLFSGTSATTFDPSGTMTRGMFVTVLSRQAQAKTDEAKPAEFTDVKDDSWYAKAIDWAFEKEYVNGTGDKTFSPDASITREQMASILSKYLTKTEAKIDTSVEAKEFADAANTSAWAKDGVNYMQTTGLMAGDTNGNFMPKKTLSRAEAAAVFMRLDQKLNGTTVDDNASNGGSNNGSNNSSTDKDNSSKDDTNKGDTNTGATTGKTTTEVAKVEDFKNVIGVGRGLKVGVSNEGLTPAGTVTKSNEHFIDTIEQERYIDFGNGIIGKAKTKYTQDVVGNRYYAKYHRITSIDIPMKIGDSVTINPADFPVPNMAWDGEENSNVGLTENADGSRTYTAHQTGSFNVGIKNNYDEDPNNSDYYIFVFTVG